MAQELTVVVTGSTGKQGGAVARGLLERGHKVRAITWFDRVGFAVDRAALHREFPGVAFHDFESWAKAQDWRALLQSA